MARGEVEAREASVIDTVLLLATVAFFAVSLAYAAACDRM
jgi:hypothetical protein